MPKKRALEFEKTDSGCSVCTSHKTRMRGYVMVNSAAHGPRLLHRVIWEQANGPIPEGMRLDHICRNRECTELTHLRLASAAENNQYAGISRRNTTGFKGVTYSKQAKKFQAQIDVDCKHIHIGLYERPEAAAAAYDEAAIRYHGEFSLTNKSLGLIS